jgi:hypothetical protein
MAFPNPLDVLRPLNGTLPGCRGAQATLSPGKSLELIKVSNGCEQGECVGVSLGIAVLGKLTADERTRASMLLPQPRARVAWKTGNANLFVDVDFLSGTTLSVIAENVTVHAQYDIAVPPWATDEEKCELGCLPAYRVQASFGYGGACRGARFTEVAFIETPGDRVTLDIPPYASTFTVLPINNVLVSAHIMGYGAIYQVTDVIVAPLSNLGQSNRIDQIPIPNGARHIEIENRDKQPASAFVLFGLGV